jgi:hypothetical protein
LHLQGANRWVSLVAGQGVKLAHYVQMQLQMRAMGAVVTWITFAPCFGHVARLMFAIMRLIGCFLQE